MKTGVFRQFLDDTIRFLSVCWNYTIRAIKRGIRALQEVNYQELMERAVTNIRLFKDSKSIYMVALFLPLILTLIIAISMNASHRDIGDMGYCLNNNQNELTLNFISGLEKQGINLYEYDTNTSCKSAVKSGKVNLCLVLPNEFFKKDNQSEKLVINVDSSKFDSFSTYLGKINSTLISTAKKGNYTESIILKSMSLENKSFNSLFIGIMMFLFMLLSILFTSTVTYHKKSYINDIYKTEKYKSFMYDVFFSSFAVMLVVSLVLLLASSLLFDFSFFIVLHKILLILILSLPLFVFCGMIIGMVTTTEELNLFVSIALTSISLFLSDLILPRTATGDSSFYLLFKLNPFYLSSSLMKDTIFGEGLDVSLVLNLVIFVLLFIILLVLINYGLVTNTGFIRNLIKEKEDEDVYVRKESESYTKAPSIQTEEMSLTQYEMIKYLQQKKKQYKFPYKPVYKDVVKVQLKERREKENKKAQSQPFKQPFKDELEDELKEVLKEPQQKPLLKKTPLKPTSQPPAPLKKSAEALPQQKEKRETDALIMSIEIENEILELRDKGLTDEQIVEKLKSKYDEEDIYPVLSNR